MAEKTAAQKLLEAAKSLLAECGDMIPDGGHASFCLWHDHVFVDISKASDDGKNYETILHAWTDPREEPMEVWPHEP